MCGQISNVWTDICLRRAVFCTGDTDVKIKRVNFISEEEEEQEEQEQEQEEQEEEEEQEEQEKEQEDFVVMPDLKGRLRQKEKWPKYEYGMRFCF